MKVRATAVAALLGLGLLGVPEIPASAGETTAAAQAAKAGQTTTAGQTAADGQSAAQPVTIAIDPTYQQPEFQGWGTSLAWLAEVTGGYPAAIRDKLVRMVFGGDGLNLNIARYNIGGG